MLGHAVSILDIDIACLSNYKHFHISVISHVTIIYHRILLRNAHNYTVVQCILIEFVPINNQLATTETHRFIPIES